MLKHPLGEPASQHDTVVEQIATSLQGEGYAVSADVPGYPQPESILGYRPDIWARGATSSLIIEVETPDSLVPDRVQQAAFRWHAAAIGAAFRIVVTDGRVFR